MAMFVTRLKKVAKHRHKIYFKRRKKYSATVIELTEIFERLSSLVDVSLLTVIGGLVTVFSFRRVPCSKNVYHLARLRHFD